MEEEEDNPFYPTKNASSEPMPKFWRPSGYTAPELSDFWVESNPQELEEMKKVHDEQKQQGLSDLALASIVWTGIRKQLDEFPEEDPAETELERINRQFNERMKRYNKAKQDAQEQLGDITMDEIASKVQGWKPFDAAQVAKKRKTYEDQQDRKIIANHHLLKHLGISTKCNSKSMETIKMNVRKYVHSISTDLLTEHTQRTGQGIYAQGVDLG